MSALERQDDLFSASCARSSLFCGRPAGNVSSVSSWDSGEGGTSGAFASLGCARTWERVNRSPGLSTSISPISGAHHLMGSWEMWLEVSNMWRISSDRFSICDQGNGHGDAEDDASYGTSHRHLGEQYQGDPHHVVIESALASRRHPHKPRFVTLRRGKLAIRVFPNFKLRCATP
jgi:hypothetical protein